MEWQIRNIARTSDLSGKPFAPGDTVSSLIYRAAGKDGIQRADLLASEVPGFDVPGQLLGRWSRLVKEPDGGEAVSGADPRPAEEFFRSLFEEADGAGQDALKHLLALALERRRILRRKGGLSADGTQRYRFAGRDEEVDVPVVDIDPGLLVKLQETLGDILL